MKQVGAKLDGPWRKSRLAARILIRKEAGRMRPRELALARRLSADPEVTNRLIQLSTSWASARANMPSTENWGQERLTGPRPQASYCNDF